MTRAGSVLLFFYVILIKTFLPRCTCRIQNIFILKRVIVDFRLFLGPPLFRGGAQRELISRTAANLDHWELALYKYCTLLLYCILIIEPKRVVEGQHYHFHFIFWNKSILPCILTSLLLSSRTLAFLKPWSIYPTFFFW